jgi:hypothetical protein
MLILILILSLALLASLSGWGTLLVQRRHGPIPTFFGLAILGLLPLTTCGLLTNFGLPINSGISAIVILFGLVCLLFKRKHAWASLGDSPVRMLVTLVLLWPSW